VSTPTVRDVPPPGVPPHVARHWAHLPWPARLKWAGRADIDRQAAERVARQARLQEGHGLDRFKRRPTTETARLALELLAEGVDVEDITTRLDTTHSAIDSALRKHGHIREARPWGTLAEAARRRAKRATEPP